MSAPRHVSVNALRMLAAGSRQARYLHMTGSAPSPSRALTGEKNIAALTSEAKKSVSKGEVSSSSVSNDSKVKLTIILASHCQRN
jgi:hypothetical protein